MWVYLVLNFIWYFWKSEFPARVNQSRDVMSRGKFARNEPENAENSFWGENSRFPTLPTKTSNKWNVFSRNETFINRIYRIEEVLILQGPNKYGTISEQWFAFFSNPLLRVFSLAPSPNGYHERLVFPPFFTRYEHDKRLHLNWILGPKTRDE